MQMLARDVKRHVGLVERELISATDMSLCAIPANRSIYFPLSKFQLTARVARSLPGSRGRKYRRAAAYPNSADEYNHRGKGSSM